LLDIVSSEKLHSSKVRVLSILVILQDANLHEECSQHRLFTPINLPSTHVHVLVIVEYGPNIAEINVDPASRLLEAHLGEFLNIVHSHASQELDLCWSVRFIALEVEIYSHVDNRDELEKVNT
jgi:hypothetical protein